VPQVQADDKRGDDKRESLEPQCGCGVSRAGAIMQGRVTMDEDRIVRLARAFCRAARIDPDKPMVADAGVNRRAQSQGAVQETMQESLPQGMQPAWMRYRAEAARVIAIGENRLGAG